MLAYFLLCQCMHGDTQCDKMVNEVAIKFLAAATNFTSMALFWRSENLQFKLGPFLKGLPAENYLKHDSEDYMKQICLDS